MGVTASAGPPAAADQCRPNLGEPGVDEGVDAPVQVKALVALGAACTLCLVQRHRTACPAATPYTGSNAPATHAVGALLGT